MWYCSTNTKQNIKPQSAFVIALQRASKDELAVRINHHRLKQQFFPLAQPLIFPIIGEN
jgi:hypothetical protein